MNFEKYLNKTITLKLSIIHIFSNTQVFSVFDVQKLSKFPQCMRYKIAFLKQKSLLIACLCMDLHKFIVDQGCLPLYLTHVKNDR